MKIPKLSPLKQIRKQCLECCCDSVKSIRFCHSTNCPLWYLRFGKFPKTVIREKGKKSELLFDKSNFIKGAIFSPEKEISLFKM